MMTRHIEYQGLNEFLPKHDQNVKGGLRQCTGHSREFASIVPMYKLYALPPMRPCSTEEVPLDTMVCIVGSIIPIRPWCRW